MSIYSNHFELIVCLSLIADQHLFFSELATADNMLLLVVSSVILGLTMAQTDGKIRLSIIGGERGIILYDKKLNTSVQRFVVKRFN